MGGVNSLLLNLIEQEKIKWALPHELVYNDRQRTEQLNLLTKFGSELQICYKNATAMNVLEYQHWWITDGTWVLEFGGGELESASVLIHCNPKAGNIIIADRFKLDSNVRQRMRNVCGATNYSLALRNCEHLARYIRSGSWVCVQMLGEGILKRSFFDYMTIYTKLINCPPKELDVEVVSGGQIFENNESFARLPGSVVGKFNKHERALTKMDDARYNILMLGPTGAGKSHLINMIFNEEIVASASSPQSVSRDLSFSKGTFEFYNNGSTVKDVTVIDTIGLCDSLLNEQEVLTMIKSKVQVNLVYLDKVVVVCSGRIEAAHARAIKRFLSWLKYSQYKDKFMFIYNKAEGLTKEEKAFNMLQMCELLGVDGASEIGVRRDNAAIKMRNVMATGFPPGADYETIEEDLETLKLGIACLGNTKPRIPVEEKTCFIL